MAVRGFDGIDDVITLDAGNTANIDGGPVTVAVWMRPDSNTQDLGVMSGRNGVNPEVYSIFLAGSIGGTGIIHSGTGNFAGFNGYLDPDLHLRKEGSPRKCYSHSLFWTLSLVMLYALAILNK